MTIRACLLGQAHTRESLRFAQPTNDSREWMRALGGGDVLNYQRVIAQRQLPERYDLAIVELTPATYRLPLLLKQWQPDVVCIGLVEGHVEPNMSSNADMEDVFRFTRTCGDYDLLGVLVARALPYYRLYTERPHRAQWLGVPYPSDWTTSLMPVRPANRELVIELGSALDSRNGITNLLLLRALQKEFRQVRGRVYWFTEREREMLGTFGIRAEFLRPRRWADYHRMLRNSFLLLCMDERRTWGRYALDAAAAGVPFIGSHTSHAGEHVAVMTCDPFDTASAFAYAASLIEERLRGGDALHREVIERQSAALESYGHAAARLRLAAALQAAGHEVLAGQLTEPAPCFAM
jgi:hypothetical protein